MPVLNGEDNIYSKTTTDSSLKLRTVLIILAVIASAMAVLFVLHAEADSSSAQIVDNGQCGPTAYYYYDSDGTLVIYGSGAIDYGVTFAPWYNYSYKITKIIIGDRITNLGEWAFVGCTNAKELTMPITLNAVFSDKLPAFAGCHSFEKITFIPGSGYGFNYAAYGGSNNWYQNTPWYLSRACLKEIVFEDGIKRIGSDAFRELNITQVVLPDSVISLGNHCFFNCEKLTDLTLPISLNSYGNEKYPAFQGCMAVQNVTFTRGNGVPFDYSDFWGEKNNKLAPWNMNPNVLKNIVISDDITSLGCCMFYGCNIKELTMPISAGEIHPYWRYFLVPYTNLEKVTITKGTGIGYDYNSWDAMGHLPWNRAPNLQTVTVEEGVTYIGDRTFYECSACSVILPNSLTSLGKYAFEYANMNYLTLPISLDAAGFGSTPIFYHVTGLVKVTFTPGSGYGFNYATYGSSDSWYQNTPWYQDRESLYQIVFEDGIKSLGSDAFRELELLNIVIPDSVESLGCHTFYNCTQLMILTIPITLDSVYSAKYPAFEGCNVIMKIQLTAGTNGIGVDYNDYAPIWCSSLQSMRYIFIDSGITYIGAHTFDGYQFRGLDGEILQPTAANLSGQVFVGMGGVMDLVARISGDPAFTMISDSATVSVSAGKW